MTPKRWTIVPFSPEHRADILDLLHHLEGYEATPQYFSWQYENNPLSDQNVFVALSGDRIAGVCGQTAYRMMFDGREHIVSFPMNAVTHPDFRGQGIYGGLIHAHENRARELGAALVMAVGNPATTPILEKKLGYRGMAAPTLLAQPVRLGRVVARATGRPWLGRIASILDPLLSPRPRRAQGVELHQIHSFDSWVDDLFTRNRRVLQRCLIRDHAFLNWRFLQDPQRRYRAFLLTEDDTRIGYFVIGVTTKRAMKIGYVASALLAPDHWHRYSDLRHLFLEDLRASGVDLCLDLRTGPINRRSRQTKHRYLPIPRKLHLIYKTIDPGLEARAVGDTERWLFQTGDFDFL
jgi:GNAT superfamily N-acetyltransferase